MKAIILAAGQGKRLFPLTSESPKAMLDIGGKTIIDRQISLFKENGINDVIIIKGYKPDSVKSAYDFRCYLNGNYGSTNMVHTLFCAESEFDDEIVVSYGDIIYSDKVLKPILKSKEQISVVVDLDWKEYFTARFGDPYEDAESLIFDSSGLIKSIGESKPNPERILAQYIGLIKFSQAGLNIVKAIYHDAVIKDLSIGWGRNIKEAYMTDLLQEVIVRGYGIHAIPVHRGWVEIDNIHDYDLANNIISQL